MSQFVPWLAENGVAPALFMRELFSTRIGAFFGWDVIVSALVFTVFAALEGKKMGWRYVAIPVVCCYGVGVSFGLPVFLAMREYRKQQN